MFDSQTALANVEAALDVNYHTLPLPHPNRTLSIWYLLTVSEDFQRNMFSGVSHDMRPAQIEFHVDALKYSIRFGLTRILKDTLDYSHQSVPRRIVPMIYERTARLLLGGIEYKAANQLCSAAHAGTAHFEEHANEIHVVIDELHHDKGYACIEHMGQQTQEDVGFASIFYAYLRLPEHRPPVVQWIAETINIQHRLISYEYLQHLAIPLAQELPQPSFLIPMEWEFNWGGRSETTLLLNALSIRCLYHLIAIHFGSEQRALRGGGESNICLILTRKQLIYDIALMSSVSPDAIAMFVEFLTYGNGTKTPDPALQPIIPLDTDKFLIPCMHFLSSGNERNLLSLQARVQSAKFNSMSSLFEKEMVSRLGTVLRPRWPLLRANILTEEVDFLIADVQSRTLLVCELRWMLGPGDPREVQNRKQVCLKKVEQLERKVRWVQSRIEEVISSAFDILPDSSWDVIGVVVIDGYSGIRSPKTEFPIMNSFVFEIGMEKAKSLAHFGEWSKSLAWLPQEGIHFNIVPQELETAGKPLKTVGIERLLSRAEFKEYITKTLEPS